MQKKFIFRTQYLIHKDFQLRYAFLLASSAILVALIIGGIFLYSLKESYDVLIQAGMASHPKVQALIHYWKNFLSYTLVMILGMLILFLTLLGIIITHKMAGPIFVLKRKLQEIQKGKWQTPMHLRKGDEFQEMKDEFNQTLLYLQNETKKEIKTLSDILPWVTNGEALSKLHAFIDEKEKKIMIV
ncbi:MAG: hypothetical protein HY390_08075 [Deltaproteobacteria bacterium]|nr:hypothetical protein [Deltaproteobacteria bacterium]